MIAVSVNSSKRLQPASIATVLILFFATLSVSAQNKKPPNIIFILADDLGWADLGCYGNKYMRTPNIDSLAKMGLRSTQAYTASPICSPSRAAILTGTHPARLKLTNFIEGTRIDSASPVLPADFIKYLPTSSTTIAEILKAKGYYTGLIGKWHLGAADSSQPVQHGFDFERVAKNGIFYYNFSLTNRNVKVDSSSLNENLTDRLTDEAISFLKENKDKPFYLHLTHFAPHLVLQPKPQKLPPYYFSYARYSQGRYDPQYAATIETLDDNIGRLMKAMDELLLWENTLLVFTSDNGGVHVEELGVKPTDNFPLREGKSHLYEGGIRIPLLMVWKKNIPAGSVTDEMIVNTDFFSLFATLANAKTNAGIDGKNIERIIRGEEKNTSRTYWWYYPHFSNQHGRPAGAIRKGNMKLILHMESGKKELYDISKDIGERSDLSSGQPALVDELSAELMLKLKEADANPLKPNPYAKSAPQKKWIK